MLLDPGDTLGAWTVVRFIASGGNGEVYGVDGPGGPAALKIINDARAMSVAYRRFRREIETVQDLGEHPGVLPIIDAHLPENPSKRDRGWYVMPLATPLATHLAGQPVASVVGAVTTVADTLAALHADGIAHRDIKPANLHWSRDRPALGDFGLVTIPDAESLTEPGRVPGAFGYIADEMIMHPDTADPLPADVFALAKVLWKLLDPSAEFPPQGPLRADGGPATLARALTVARADALDRVLEAATARADLRIDMARLATELRGWLALEEAIATPAGLDAAMLAARRSMDGTLRLREAEAARERAVSALAEHLMKRSRTLIDTVASLDPSRAEVGAMAVGKLFQLIEQPTETVGSLYGKPFHHGVRVTRGPDYDQEVLVLAFCLQVDENGNGAVNGLILAGDETVASAPWQRLATRTAALGVQLEAAVDAAVEEATQALPRMLETFAGQSGARAAAQSD